MNNLLEVEMCDDESFLKIRETLTRIGIANNKTKTLYQSCHILNKRGKIYIVHFKEMLKLDGRITDFNEEDKERRNDIAKLLQEWKLCKIVNIDEAISNNYNKFRVISYKDSKEGGWTLNRKYQIGVRKKAK